MNVINKRSIKYLIISSILNSSISYVAVSSNDDTGIVNLQKIPLAFQVQKGQVYKKTVLQFSSEESPLALIREQMGLKDNEYDCFFNGNFIPHEDEKSWRVSNLKNNELKFSLSGNTTPNIEITLKIDGKSQAYKFNKDDYPLNKLRDQKDEITVDHCFTVAGNRIPKEEEIKWTTDDLKGKEIKLSLIGDKVKDTEIKVLLNNKEHIFKFEKNDYPLTELRKKLESITDKHCFCIDDRKILKEEEGNWTADELKGKSIKIPPLSIKEKLKGFTGSLQNNSGQAVIPDKKSVLCKDPFDQSRLSPAFKMGPFASLETKGIQEDGPGKDTQKHYSDDYGYMNDKERAELITGLSLSNGIVVNPHGSIRFNHAFYNAACWQNYSGYMKPKYTLQTNKHFTVHKKIHEAHTSGMWDIGGSAGMAGLFNVQGSYKSEKEVSHKDTKKTLYMSQNYDVEKVILKISTDNLGPSEEFLASINQSLQTYDQETCKPRPEQSFYICYNALLLTFKKYGHYLPTKFILGGRMQFEDTTNVTSTDDAERIFSGFSIGCEANLGLFGIPVSGGIKGGKSDEKRETDQVYDKDQRITRRVIGGSASKISNAADWIGSLNYYQNWYVLERGDFIPVVNCLPPEIKSKIAGVLSWIDIQNNKDNKFPINIRNYISDMNIPFDISTINNKQKFEIDY